MTNSPPETVWIFHFTPLENLPGILEAGGIVCKNRCRTQQATIAHAHIQDRRSHREVPCGPGGNLHDYVPFYFCPRSPMLYAIHGGNVVSYDKGQKEIVYLVLKLRGVVEAGLDFVFTDRHAVTRYATFSTDVSDLQNIDWNLMESKWWNDIAAYPDRKERKQAEFLVHEFLAWDLVEYIGVMTPRMKERVEALVDDRFSGACPTVLVRDNWYYR